MVKTKFYRKGNIIRESLGKKKYQDHKFSSNNEAKRKSAELQKANGGIGMGSLVLVDKFPRFV